ncbi:peptide-methionine (R)-S-oxide reductase [Candidatus Pacearchaeota archaeon CG10_big_fil_rev_8_21_14_0_10_32_14]|nr:MAG: peptide-methionine (R)-S-oxide reductase [Candidatus Pacearchaeota archaeon CG10_big_fil_rev_8_21_14_0_10_32_14]
MKKPSSMPKTDKDWKKKLSPEQYSVLREADTEEPYTSPLLKEKRKGVFTCVACGNELFDSSTKFESGTGWPSFYDLKSNKTINLKSDTKMLYPRIEVLCAKCGGHLGHLFTENKTSINPTGRRYCINGTCLAFKAKK